MRTVFRVVPEEHGWTIIRDGTALGLFASKPDAVRRASVQAKSTRPSCVVVVGEGGGVELERYYGADESPPDLAP